jgi:hypothetical protein
MPELLIVGIAAFLAGVAVERWRRRRQVERLVRAVHASAANDTMLFDRGVQ